MTQPDKDAIAATGKQDTDKIENLVLDGAVPKLVTHDVLVGDLITTVARNSKSHVNSKIEKAHTMAVRLDFAPVPRSKKVAASCTAIIPKAFYATQWDIPNASKTGRLRTGVIGA